jgi:hypothetical protein
MSPRRFCLGRKRSEARDRGSVKTDLWPLASYLFVLPFCSRPWGPQAKLQNSPNLQDVDLASIETSERIDVSQVQKGSNLGQSKRKVRASGNSLAEGRRPIGYVQLSKNAAAVLFEHARGSRGDYSRNGGQI